MKALGIAVATTLGITALGYALLLGIGAVVGSWSADVVGQQARALLLHYAVVAARGILPVALLIGAARAALPGAFAARPRQARIGSALLSALLVVPTILPLPTGPLPRLRIEGGTNLVASVVLLAAVCALGWWLGVDRRPGEREPDAVAGSLGRP